jgi:hypothetical protein
MSRLHLADGLYFEQLHNGGVRITKYESGHEGSTVLFQQDIDSDGWASVIATMSYYGEIDSGFYRALNFHTGAPLNSTTPLNLNRLR